MTLTQRYTATSLDGSSADPSHSLVRRFARDQSRQGPLNDAEFMANVGALANGHIDVRGSRYAVVYERS